MKKTTLKTPTTPRWLLAVYLILFLGIAVPFHHHDDFATRHDDCAICAVSNQPFVASEPYQILILFVVLFIIAFNHSFGSFSTKDDLHLRGPPIL